MRCFDRPHPWLGYAVSVALASVGCSSGVGDGQGDFDVYVPSATRVVRVADLVVDRVSIGLSESLVIEIGEAIAGRPNQFQIAADSNGRVFTVDVIDGDVRRFSPSGAPIIWSETGAEVLAFDRSPLGLGTDGEGLFLTNADPGQLRRVSQSGDLVGDFELDGSPWKPVGLGDDTFVAMFLETGVVGRYSFDGTEIARYTVFHFPEQKLGGDPRIWPHQDVAVGRQRVYVTTAETHQVSAFDIDGESVWVLEGEAERVAMPEHITGKTLGRSRRAGRAAGSTIDAEYGQVKWPEFYPALARIATDAQDRLYVFPYVIEEKSGRYPVNVYDATGTLIMNGWLPFQGWDTFAGDSIYRVERHDDKVVVVRYELDLRTARAGRSAGQ